MAVKEIDDTSLQNQTTTDGTLPTRYGLSGEPNFLIEQFQKVDGNGNVTERLLARAVSSPADAKQTQRDRLVELQKLVLQLETLINPTKEIEVQPVAAANGSNPRL
ncbi:hypothetical protein VTK73DRAFT_9670 [Phialemonium thermophilum]|uniref:Uncharacterized protein n=1 Tax=Phialemonium thermophilum TaxID=223376 RepID=A0ABR3XK20_9PEZI